MRCSAPFLVALVAFAAAGAAGRALPRQLLQANQCTTLPLGWNLLMRTGDTVMSKDAIMALQVNEENQGIYASLRDTQEGQFAGQPAVSTQPDFTSLLHLDDGSLWMVSQFESPQPSVVYMVGLEQDQTNGKLTPTSIKPVDFSEWGGVWITCAGSVTPWKSHMGGEEYEPDAHILSKATSLDGLEETSLTNLDEDYLGTVLDYMRYWGDMKDNMTIDDVRAAFNPYHFGWTFEVKVLGASGDYTAHKWYAMGRSSKELAYVMPDNKTVYHTDDGERVGFWKFVANTPNDMSAGTLYGAKMTQTADANGGSFDIEWINLGNTTQDEIKTIIDSGITFADIFDAVEPDENATCADGYTSVNTGVAGHECLMLKEGQEKAAAFLETRRYTAMLGGTTEFSKWEGFTFSPKRMEAYTAMSEIRRAMEDNAVKGEADDEYDVGGPNDVRVKFNQCGCVYMLKSDENYSLNSMTALICGFDNPDTADEANTCSTESIASPDNLSVADELDILFIGEDAGATHQNDMVWSYDLNTGNITRVFTSVYGAETTSVYWHPNINGFSYLMSVVQHPYLESDEDKVTNPFSEGLQGYIGYFTMPAAETAGKTLKFAEVPVPRDEKAGSTNTGSESVQVCPKEPAGPTVVTPEQTSAAPAPMMA